VFGNIVTNISFNVSPNVGVDVSLSYIIYITYICAGVLWFLC